MKFIKKFFKKEVKKTEEKNFLIEISGHKFYCLDSIPSSSVNRFYYFISKSEEINGLGVPLDYYNAIGDQLAKMYEDSLTEISENKLIKDSKIVSYLPKIVDAIRYANDKERLKWYWLTVACVEAFILIDDEPINEMSFHHNKLKSELLLKNPDARFFFINTASQYLTTLQVLSKDLNLEDYFRNLTIDEADLQNTMSHLSSMDSGNPELKQPVK